MELKVGMICKHFKGTSLLEKNIYEIIAISPTYTGSNDIDLTEMVIYKPIFQEGKIFVREYLDLVSELSIEEKRMYKQDYRIEPLTDFELKIINSASFINEKIAYEKEKYKQKQI